MSSKPELLTQEKQEKTRNGKDSLPSPPQFVLPIENEAKKEGTGSVRFQHEDGPPCVCDPLKKGGDRAGGAVCMCNPWNPSWGPSPLQEGEVVIIPGRKDYTLKMPKKGGIYCTCEGWQYHESTYPPQCRICKHGTKILTEAFGSKGNLIAMKWKTQGIERLGPEYVPKRERPEEIARKEEAKKQKCAQMVLPKPTQPFEVQPYGLPTPTKTDTLFTAEDFALAFDVDPNSSSFDEQFYHWSIKLDGVRGFWNGKNFGSKSGNLFQIPKEIIDMMPQDISMDGEFYAGIDVSCQKISGLLRRKTPNYADWRTLNVTFNVFDAPFIPGDFCTRLNTVKQLIGNNHPFIKVVEYKPIDSKEDLKLNFQKIVNAGEEGIMLRLIHGVYRPGRTSDLLKMKDVQHDEAIVIADNDPKDSVTCRLRSGKEFNLSCDGTRHPKIDKIVVVKFKCLTHNGVPREPKLVGICRRIDVDPSEFVI